MKSRKNFRRTFKSRRTNFVNHGWWKRCNRYLHPVCINSIKYLNIIRVKLYFEISAFINNLNNKHLCDDE